MALANIIGDVERQEKTLTVFNPGDDVTTDLAEYVRTLNVAVRSETTETGRPADFAVLSRGTEFITAVPVSDLRALMDAVPSGPDGIGIDDSAYYDFLRHLKETTFTSYDRSDMWQASREIEDRAWRTGEGRLLAGFQYASVLEGERETYERLATLDIDVHAFAVADCDLEPIAGVATHLHDEGEELSRTWFVVYDGAGEYLNKTALLAEERDPGEFYGFWTYDPDVVDRIVAHIDRRYGVHPTPQE